LTGGVIAGVGGAALVHAALRPMRSVFDLELPLIRARRHPVGPLVRHLSVAAIWALPLALAVVVLLDLLAAYPPAPVFCTIVVLTLVGSGFTEDRGVLSKGLRCTLAIAAASVVAAHVSRSGFHSPPLGSELGIGLWLSGAVLLLASTSIRERERERER
jgi:hypothetical protein